MKGVPLGRPAAGRREVREAAEAAKAARVVLGRKAERQQKQRSLGVTMLLQTMMDLDVVMTGSCTLSGFGLLAA
jgi:hypothetical protein